MKRIAAILLAAVMVTALFAVIPSAKGYTLSVPTSVCAHNLEAYGLHTMNVYETLVPPSIDGIISEGEYPGPNGGVSLSAVPGDNLWMSGSGSISSQDNYDASRDFTPYVASEDVPEYINTRLTYDGDFVYFAVTTTIPAVRVTSNTNGRSAYWWIDTRFSFMQSERIAEAHCNSLAATRYTLHKNANATTAYSASISNRKVTRIDGSQYFQTSYPNYVDEVGVTWDTVTYKRASNFSYVVDILPNGKWSVTFEGKQPIGDLLRITDMEYEDGTPLDYIPEWGYWGFDMSTQANVAVSTTTPNGSSVVINPDDRLFAQTMLPTYGLARSGSNGIVSGYLIHNTVRAAIPTVGGLYVNYLMNPVHFLGVYEEGFNYDGTYSEPAGTAVATTTRVTRTRPLVLTSGVRGVNNRLFGSTTQASGATGDSLVLTIVLAVAMILCAATAVVVVVLKKRSHRVQ